ncbi:GAF domain-containing protein [Methanococcoides sp. SA1]|nr:GAF domain-containing protein [Methanococcoides sp. SA1]
MINTEEIETIINSSQAVIFLWKTDEDWTVDFVSENILLFGYDTEEFKDGKLKYAEIIHPEDLDQLKKSFLEYTNKSKCVGFTRQYRIITKFGEIRWVDERSLIKRNENGDIDHVQGIIFDITENKKTEEALRINELRLETLLKLNQMSAHSVKEIIKFTLDESLKITGSEFGYFALLDQSENILTIHSVAGTAIKNSDLKTNQRIYPVEQNELWWEAIRQRQPVITNDQFSSSFGKRDPETHLDLIRHMDVPICDGQKIVAVVGVGNKRSEYKDFDVKQLKLLFEDMWNIIQRKELVDALKLFSKDFEKANNDLRSINSIKREFIDNREDPSTLICEGSFVEKETLRSLNEQQDKAVEIAIKSSEKLKSIVDSLLYLDVEQFGKKNYNPSQVNVRSILENATMNVILRIDEKNITLTKKIPDEITTITADKDKITEVLTRVIESLIQFIPENGNINIEVSEEDNNVNFDLKDNGFGIPEALISNLFIRFYQIQEEDSSASSKVYEELKSTFYLCKNIIETHGGELRVESKEGRGTTIHISLPRYKTL